jgi:CMP-N,N'-diacetyllegionaminic acid synthase
MSDTVVIIPARGGSKGIPHKNIVDLCGKPLIAWSILQARAARSVDSVWVTSDSAEILDVAVSHGANPIRRPAEISGDVASSESAWLHALDTIESGGTRVDLAIGMQATSPVREPSDLDKALVQFERERLDSLLTCCEVEDFFMWRYGPDGQPIGVNHDYKNRARRQNIEKRYLENGSFYVFKPDMLRAQGNRLAGKIGIYVMEKHKMFQIDNPQDIALCRAIMRGYGLDK